MKKRWTVEDENGTRQEFEVRVFLKDDVWTSTLHRVNEKGEAEEKSGVAPTFYGVSPDQAERMMRKVVENTFDDILSEEVVEGES